MPARLTLLAITVFWVTMNVLLWRSEYGSHSDDFPVPLVLVWNRILSAPEVSSLSVFQNHERMGYCELATGVGQQMATLDEDRPPPEGFVAQAGSRLHLTGNIGVGDFTNRFKFDIRLQFDTKRQWQELAARITSRQAVMEVHSLATNQAVEIRVSSEGDVVERRLTFAELQNPGALLRAYAGPAADLLPGGFDLPGLGVAAGQSLQWEARRTRMRIGSQLVPVYRLQTGLLGRNVTVDVSTLGEILRVDLAGEIEAQIDELERHD